MSAAQPTVEAPPAAMTASPRRLRPAWRRRTGRVPFRTEYVLAGLAALAVSRSLGAWFVLGAKLDPDASFLAESGFGLFPSLLGTAVGSLFGLHGLAVVNALASGAVVLLVAAIAARLGGSPVVAACLVLFLPAAWVTMFVGLDALGTALCLAALLAYLQGRSARAAGFAVTACLAHYSVIPIVVAGLVAAGRKRALFGAAAVVTGAVALALLTAYRAALPALAEPLPILLWGGLSIALAGAWLLPWARRLVAESAVRRVLCAATLAAAGTAGVIATVEEGGTQVRYTLPAVALACAAAAARRPAAPSSGPARRRGIGAADLVSGLLRPRSS